MHQGCLRPLLISAGLLAIVVLVAVLLNRGTVSLLVANTQAMGEGAEIAGAMQQPEDVLDFIAAYPEHVSLVAFDLGDEAEGIFYQPDVRRPVAGLPRLLVLAEYLRQVQAGEINPQESIPLDTLEAAFLPGADAAGHARMMADLRETNPERATLGQIVEAMMQHNSAAATDLLIAQLGRPAMAALPERFGMDALDPPLPTAGLFLSWHSSTGATAAERLAALEAAPPDVRDDEVYHLAERYRRDSTFRRHERERLTTRGSSLSLPDQRAFAEQTYPRGTARAYAALLALALTDSLLAPGLGGAMRPYLERALPDSVGTALEVIGSEAGSFPGLISFAGYATRDDLPQGRVVVLLMDELPFSVFYHLLQTGLDQGFLLQLLGDDAFFERARQHLRRPEQTSEASF
ncbi:MAG: serine hydrolase [Rhodothermales bacterium]